MLRTLFELFGNYYANGDFSGVEMIIRSILVTVPDDLASLQFLGLVYYRTGRVADAMRVFGKTERGPHRTARFETGQEDDYLSRHGYSAAAACQFEATRRNPDLARAWYDLGVTFRELGRPERAIGAFRSALVASPALREARLAMDAVGGADGLSRRPELGTTAGAMHGSGRAHGDE